MGDKESAATGKKTSGTVNLSEVQNAEVKKVMDRMMEVYIDNKNFPAPNLGQANSDLSAKLAAAVKSTNDKLIAFMDGLKAATTLQEMAKRHQALNSAMETERVLINQAVSLPDSQKNPITKNLINEQIAYLGRISAAAKAMVNVMQTMEKSNPGVSFTAKTDIPATAQPKGSGHKIAALSQTLTGMGFVDSDGKLAAKATPAPTQTTERVYLLNIKSPDSEPCYYFVLINSQKEEAFLKVMDSGEGYDINDYGTILHSGYGKPSEELKNEIAARYKVNF